MRNTLLSDTYSYKSGGSSTRYTKQAKESARSMSEKPSYDAQIENYKKLFADSDGEAVGSVHKVLKGLKRFEPTDSQALMYANSGTVHGSILKFAD